MSRERRRMTSATISTRRSPLEMDRANRRRVRDWTRMKSGEDAVAHAVHRYITGTDYDQDVIAAFSMTPKRVFVERVGILTPLSSNSGTLEIPSLAASEERSIQSALALSIEGAERSILHHGGKLDGLFVAFFETGLSSVDREAFRTLKSLARDGFRLDHTPSSPVAEEIGDIAARLVPGRPTWRNDIKLAYAPAEKVFGLASEKIQIENWIREFCDAEDLAGVNLAGRVLESIGQMGGIARLRASHLYTNFLDEIARRIKIISTTASPCGTSLSLELRYPDNDNCNLQRKTPSR